MYLFKAPFLAFAFLLLVAIPESSFAQCSASAGKIHGCRSGIACNIPNKRTGAPLWQCQDVAPAAVAPLQVAAQPALTAGSSKSAPTKKPSTAKKSTEPKPTIESSEVVAEEEPPQQSSSSSSSSSRLLGGVDQQGMCPTGYVEVKSNNHSDYVEEAGDTQAGSFAPYAVRFCRQAGMTQEQANAMKSRGGGETCNAAKGQEFQESGVTKCRYIKDGENGEAQVSMVCIIENGQLTECNAEEAAKVADGGSCEQRFNEARDTCFKQADKASTDCDQENQGIQDAMNATKAVGAGSAASVQLACSKLGEISKIANTSLTGWQTFCAFSQSGCETACSDAKTMYNDPQCIPEANKKSYTTDMTTVQQNVNVCMGYKKRISEAAQHATAALVQAQAAKKCEDDTSSLTTANVDECKKNPNNPLCTDAQKCSNATFAASNKVCQCINNPNSKDCIANNGLAGSRGVAGATIPGVGSGKDADPGAAFIPPASGSGTDAFANALQSGAVKNEQNLGGSKGNAGLGGNTGGPGGGGGLGSGAGGAAGAAGDDKLKINSGFYGAATGGGYLGKPGGAYGSGRLSAGGVNYNKLGAGGAQFDPRRYIAGLNGKTGEYINGPNMDIFRIVKNRIESKKPTMLDPDYKK
ncbi:MAG: hypothetical protein B7Y39_03410 [Bdellovibrio sp. 28-41-41]|nr:MAG: hypothetical protein B7Y39_03410 [Bdellovibrio sp. 28-41-41]